MAHESLIRVSNINTDVEGSIFKLQHWQKIYEKPFFNPDCQRVIKEADVKKVLESTGTSTRPARTNKHGGVTLPRIPTKKKAQCNNALDYFKTGEGRKIVTRHYSNLGKKPSQEMVQPRMKSPDILVKAPSKINFDRYSVTKLLRRPLLDAQIPLLAQKRSELYDSTDIKFRKYSYATFIEDENYAGDNFYKVSFPCLLKMTKRRAMLNASLMRLLQTRTLKCDSLKFELSNYLLQGRKMTDIMDIDIPSETSLDETDEELVSTFIKESLENAFQPDDSTESEHDLLRKQSNIVLHTLYGDFKRGGLWEQNIQPDLQDIDVSSGRKKYKYLGRRDDTQAEKIFNTLKFFEEILNRVYSEEEVKQPVESPRVTPKSSLSSQSEVSLGGGWNSGSELSIDDVTDYKHLLNFGVSDDQDEAYGEGNDKKDDVADEGVQETDNSVNHATMDKINRGIESPSE